MFQEVRRVLRPDGTLWLNMGDSFCSSPGEKGNRGTRDDDPKYNAGNGRLAGPNRAHIPGLKPKDLFMMPARVALALQADGWWLRQDIIWSKPNPMPESVTDRPTTAHEHLFLLAKSSTYFYDAEAVREGKGGFADSDVTTVGRNKRSVWTIATEPYPEAHFATFPQALVGPCIRAGTSARGVCADCGAPWERVIEVKDPEGRLGKGYHDHEDDLGRGQRGVFGANGAPTKTTIGWRPICSCPGLDGDGPWPDLAMHPDGEQNWPTEPAVVLDPFAGAGTVAVVARKLGRRSVGIELNPEYVAMARKRLEGVSAGMALGV